MLKENSFYAVSMAIIYVVIGILMLVRPKFICDAVNYIIGAFIIIVGLTYLFKLLQDKNIREFSKLELLIGFFAIGFGIFLIINSNLLVSILPLATGIIILIDALSQISSGFKLKKCGNKTWYINILVGVLFLSFAIFVIINAKETSYLIVKLIGAVLMLDGLFEMINFLRMKPYEQTSVKVIEAEIETKKD